MTQTDPLMAIVQSFNVEQVRRTRAINAYRQNIALPDVYIADKDVPLNIKVLGEDGQELTPEMRKKRMEGKQTYIDPATNRIRDINFGAQFAGEIKPEPLGESAVKNRPPIRQIVPRELELL